jgi:hypothetical protein
MMVSKGRDRKVNPGALSASSTIGYGVVKTIIPSDKEFCFSKDCTYSLRLETNKIEALHIATSVFDNTVNDIDLNGGFGSYLDELRVNDVAYYTFHLKPKTPLSDWHWKFTMLPIEGDADMSLSVDRKPDNLTDYKYLTSTTKSESIVVSGEVLAKEGLEGKTMYLATNSTKGASFALHVAQISRLDPILLGMDEQVTGEVVHSSIDNYIFSPSVSHPESIEVFLRLSTLSGNPDVYVKDCSGPATSECLINSSDIKDRESLSKDKTRFFRYSAESSDDQLYLSFNCLPAGDQFKSYVFTGSSKDLYTSSTCRFAVGVQGKPTSTSQFSRYQLQLRGAKFHEQLRANQTGSFTLYTGGYKYYALDVGKAADRDSFLNLHVTVASGDADVFVSAVYPFPGDGMSDRHESFDNDNRHHVSETKVLTIDRSKQPAVKHYYVAIEVSSCDAGAVVCQRRRESRVL